MEISSPPLDQPLEITPVEYSVGEIVFFRPRTKIKGVFGIERKVRIAPRSFRGEFMVWESDGYWIVPCPDEQIRPIRE